MNHIHIKSFGFATGITADLLYLGCVVVMNVTGPEVSKAFFNNLFHGFDVSSILRMNMSFTDTMLGLLQTFMIAWLAGASVAAVYNLVTIRKTGDK